MTLKRTKGRTSAAKVPSARAIKTTSYSLAKPAITCDTRGSLARAMVSTLPSKATFWVLSREAMGSKSWYSERLPATLRAGTFTRAALLAAAIVRTVCAASVREAREISSEYANAVFSPLTARTPTPWSMLKEPVFTMPSSKLQPSARVYWKYKSASSTLCALMAESVWIKSDSSKPKGSNKRRRATSKRSMVGSREIIR